MLKAPKFIGLTAESSTGSIKKNIKIVSIHREPVFFSCVTKKKGGTFNHMVMSTILILLTP